MPLVGEHHQRYWNLSDTTVPPLRLTRGGYPAWQAAVVVPSLFGAIGAWWDVQYARLKWWWGFAPRVHRLDPERRAVLEKVLATIESPTYITAQTAVRGTAQTLGFNRPEAWKGLSHHMKDDPGRAENVYRHLEAVRRVRATLKAHGSTLSNPDANLVVELAYTGFAWKGR